MSSLLSKAKYIQLIHIAKTQLKLDDESYRAVLMGCGGEDSCKLLGRSDLNKVLVRMRAMGFKAVSKKRSGTSFIKDNKTQLSKLRQVWREMDKAGYLRDGTDKGLLGWSKVQAKRLNKNVPVQKLEWLKPSTLQGLIEQLKQWQKRCGDSE